MALVPVALLKRHEFVIQLAQMPLAAKALRTELRETQEKKEKAVRRQDYELADTLKAEDCPSSVTPPDLPFWNFGIFLKI